MEMKYTMATLARDVRRLRKAVEDDGGLPSGSTHTAEQVERMVDGIDDLLDATAFFTTPQDIVDIVKERLKRGAIGGPKNEGQRVPDDLWTQDQANAYNNKIACPNCHSTDYEIGEPQFEGCRKIVALNECNDCGAEWYDAFRLYGIGVENVESESGQDIAVRTFA